MTRTITALGALALVLATTGRAEAQTACDTLTNPVYMQIGDTQQPLIKDLGRALRDNPAQPVTLVYITSGSCDNIAAIYEDTPIELNMLYIPSVEEDPDWVASDPPLQCVPPVGGVVPDIANSNVFISACPGGEDTPMGIGVYSGPVQAYVMAVPEDSDEIAMTAEEAYFVFGFGADGMVDPWDDEEQMFIRTTSKSTLLSWAANVTVPAARWKGIMFDKSSDVVAALQNSTAPAKAVGILGAEVYDRFRDTLDVLAYRAFDQRYAYYPDSTRTAHDKRNVRDGHYTVWSPTVYLTKVDVDDEPVNLFAGYVIDLILGVTADPTPNFNPTEIVAAQGLIPDCAMAVSREFEGGELSLYEPAEPCGCYYDSLNAPDEVTCETCGPADPCADGVCRNGFCEER
jgi:hypothetical protein